MDNAYDILLGLAEISVALAGFAAVVVLFRRDDAGRWAASHADRFHGMITHALFALAFCLFPQLVATFTTEPSAIWAVSSTLLAIQIAAHVFGIWFLATTSIRARAVVGLGLLFALANALNAAGIHFERAFAPYAAGIIWHILQSAGLFAGLIWISPAEREARK